MTRPKWNRVAAALCLLALMTVAAQCSEQEEAIADIAGNIIADAAMTMESTIFPEETEELTEEPTEEPEATEVGFADDSEDVFNPMNGQLANNYWGGVDLTGISLRVVDPDSGLVEFRASFDEVEDHESELAANPYWGLIVAGDGDPDGTPPLPGLDLFGLGQYHVGCFWNGQALECQLWIREGSQFVEGTEPFPAIYIDGDVTFTFPEGYPRQGDRLGVAVIDPYSADTLGLEDLECEIDFGELKVDWD